jgi:hypothetical protein
MVFNIGKKQESRHRAGGLPIALGRILRRNWNASRRSRVDRGFTASRYAETESVPGRAGFRHPASRVPRLSQDSDHAAWHDVTCRHAVMKALQPRPARQIGPRHPYSRTRFQTSRFQPSGCGRPGHAEPYRIERDSNWRPIGQAKATESVLAPKRRVINDVDLDCPLASPSVHQAAPRLRQSRREFNSSRICGHHRHHHTLSQYLESFRFDANLRLLVVDNAENRRIEHELLGQPCGVPLRGSSASS